MGISINRKARKPKKWPLAVLFSITPRFFFVLSSIRFSLRPLLASQITLLSSLNLQSCHSFVQARDLAVHHQWNHLLKVTGKMLAFAWSIHQRRLVKWKISYNSLHANDFIILLCVDSVDFCCFKVGYTWCLADATGKFFTIAFVNGFYLVFETRVWFD